MGGPRGGDGGALRETARASFIMHPGTVNAPEQAPETHLEAKQRRTILQLDEPCTALGALRAEAVNTTVRGAA